MDKLQTFYQLTAEMVALQQQIEQQVLVWTDRVKQLPLQQLLRLQHKSLHANLALDHNSLSLNQLQELFAAKRVVALAQDIQQASNALQLNQQLQQFKPYQSEDLRTAHALLMNTVSSDAGHYRQHGAGVYEGHKLVHMPPAPATVSLLVEQLFDKLLQDQLHPLLASCLMHYQLAFIHPFSDGNGRLCRFWQHLILSQWHSSLLSLPWISVLKDKSRDYYKNLRQSTPKYDASSFILFMLRCISQSLNDELQLLGQPAATAVAHLPDQPLVDLSQFIALKQQKVKTKSSGPWYRTEDQILKKLKKDNRLSAKTIADELGLTSRAIEKQLAKLKAEGKLIRTGPAKGGRWQVVA